ncbi:coiled-coil domain-containing protein 34 [Trichomycterus rosablanca]|uniref:coiled-coil domain-containing protein 34 n=1 Tax=Trichomycterus rosablanca TaxID=2290929 RepID=UPI002F358B5B
MSAPTSSKSFTSTPLKSKSIIPRSIPRSRSLDSTGNSIYSILSPIYHDSFNLSDEDNEEAQKQHQPANYSSAAHEDVLSVSPSRNESPHIQDASTAKLNLSAWEQWLVRKAKEDRLKIHQKVLEQQSVTEKKKQEDVEQQRKKAASECKIQEWLQMKKEQDKLCRESRKSKELLHDEKKRLEIEKKTQEKYKEWFQKKKHEEKERKLKEQEETARRDQEEREQKEKAEDSFKQWLKSIKNKDKHKRQSSACLTRGYDNLNYPAPSFVNPVPWKPIHIPQEIKTPRKNSKQRKHSGEPKHQLTFFLNFKPKDTISFAHKRLTISD